MRGGGVLTPPDPPVDPPLCPDYVTSIWDLHVREAAGSFSCIFSSVILCHSLLSAVRSGSVTFPASSLIWDKMC